MAATASFEQVSAYNGELTVTITYNTTSLAITKVAWVNNTANPHTVTCTNTSGQSQSWTIPAGNSGSAAVPVNTYFVASDGSGGVYVPGTIAVN